MGAKIRHGEEAGTADVTVKRSNSDVFFVAVNSVISFVATQLATKRAQVSLDRPRRSAFVNASHMKCYCALALECASTVLTTVLLSVTFEMMIQVFGNSKRATARRTNVTAVTVRTSDVHKQIALFSCHVVTRLTLKVG